MPTAYDRDRLHALIGQRALKFGDFTLASGKTSSYYLDLKQITLHAAGLRDVAAGMVELAGRLGLELGAVGGMSIGADPIVGGFLTHSAAAGEGADDLVGVMVRKEAKGHGTGRFIEGPLEPGMNVLIVEDVVTTGGSSLRAADRVREFGATPVAVLAVVDRLQGGAAAFEAAGLPLHSLFTVEDFGITPPADG